MRTTVSFDPHDTQFLRDRYPTYRTLRDEAPNLALELNGRDCRIITRYADVDALLRDDRARVQPEGDGLPSHLGSGAAAQFYRNSLPCIDPPDHARLRKLVMPAFAPRTVAAMRGWIDEIIRQRVAELAGEGEIDFVKDVAAVVPARIACRFLHVPESDAELLLSRHAALNQVLSQATMDAAALAAADEAAQFYFDYFERVVETLRGRLPEDDLVGVLLQAADDGDRLSHVELTVTLVGLLIASYHTTRVSLTTAVHTLLTQQDQLELLRREPALAATAWEESLRFDAPIHFIWRDLHAPVEIAGEKVDAGTHLVLGLAAANRDERRFPDADRFDIRRSDRRHLSFAAGGHYCPGAPLSRLEGELFLPRFFAAFPEMRLLDEAPPRSSDLTFAYIESLPLDLGCAR